VTTEIRRTNATGGAKGDKLARFDQIPAEPLLELAYRYGLGSTKYPAVNGLDNWRNGYEFSLSIAALERHINAFKRGEDNDDTIYREAGLIGDDEDPLYDEEGKLRPGVSHLAAAAWHCFFLMHHLVHHPELDDRPTTVLRRKAEQPMELVLSFDGSKDPAGFALLMETASGFLYTPKANLSATKKDYQSSGDPKLWEEVGHLTEQSKETDSEDGFTLARDKHRSLLNDWHNRPVGDDVILRHPVGGGAATRPRAEIKADLEKAKANVAPVVETADVWAHQKGILVMDWDGIAPGEVVTEVDFDARVAGCTVTTKARPDEWLKYYNIELIQGDLGDTYAHITYEEFEDRLRTAGNAWKMSPVDDLPSFD
jgi:hypothetical protein